MRFTKADMCSEFSAHKSMIRTALRTAGYDPEEDSFDEEAMVCVGDYVAAWRTRPGSGMAVKGNNRYAVLAHLLKVHTDFVVWPKPKIARLPIGESHMEVCVWGKVSIDDGDAYVVVLPKTGRACVLNLSEDEVSSARQCGQVDPWWEVVEDEEVEWLDALKDCDDGEDDQWP